jgi:hypothetical protein
MGYSMMTSLLSDCSKGKLLVILEGGYVPGSFLNLKMFK